MPHLKSFSVRNYKAFQEAHIELRPITILLGANSAGKTSLLNILRLFQETIAAGSNDAPSCLRINSRYLSFGPPHFLHYFGDQKQPIEIQLEFNCAEIIKDLSVELLEEFTRFLAEQNSEFERLLYLAQGGLNDGATLRRTKISIPNRESDRREIRAFDEQVEEELDRNLELRDRLDVFAKSDPSISEALLGYSDATPRKRFGYSVADLRYSWQLLREVWEITPQTTTINFCVGTTEDKQLTFRGLSVSFDNICLLGVEVDPDNEPDGMFVTTAFLEQAVLDKVCDSLLPLIDLTAPLREMAGDRETRTFLPRILGSFVSAVMGVFNQAFSLDCLRHVEPMRAQPRRSYDLSRIVIDPSVGNPFVEVLKEHELLRKQVNDFATRFKIKFSVDDIDSFLLRLRIDRGVAGLTFDLPDVGFGFSQVLPVIVDALTAPKDSVSVVEQPEVHLHPKAQSDLGDLFMEATQGKPSSKVFILETHSEYLVKRLRRRISEGKLESKDVALYFVSQDPNSMVSQIAELPIQTDGDFEWPPEFFERDRDDIKVFYHNVRIPEEGPAVR